MITIYSQQNTKPVDGAFQLLLYNLHLRVPSKIKYRKFRNSSNVHGFLIKMFIVRLRRPKAMSPSYVGCRLKTNVAIL
jgi:hypothetical protein